MSNAPREPALISMLRATVRVDKGSGVVVRNGGVVLVATAQHVVSDDGPHRIRWRGNFEDATVLAEDKVADVAVLAAPKELEGAALTVADAKDGALTGDEVWASGFPRGWNDTDPLHAKGVISGVARESWVNLGETWGNSGGPLCVIHGGAPVVVGIVGGRAGDVNRRLEMLRKHLAEQHESALKHPFISPVVSWVDPALQTLDGITGLLRQMADLMDDHSRTGFLRFAGASELRRLLSVAAGHGGDVD